MTGFWLEGNEFSARWGEITEESATAVSDHAVTVLGAPSSVTPTTGEDLGPFAIVGDAFTRHWNHATDAQLDTIVEYATRLLGTPDTVA